MKKLWIGVFAGLVMASGSARADEGADLAKAREAGVPPGSMIMIHGTPDTEDTPEDLFHTLDWTDGCVAMRNRDMREVWNLVPDGTMIEIRP